MEHLRTVMPFLDESLAAGSPIARAGGWYPLATAAAHSARSDGSLVAHGAFVHRRSPTQDEDYASVALPRAPVGALAVE